jgi:hypothetical protein
VDARLTEAEFSRYLQESVLAGAYPPSLWLVHKARRGLVAGDETIEAMGERVLSARGGWSRHPGETIALVSHADLVAAWIVLDERRTAECRCEIKKAGICSSTWTARRRRRKLHPAADHQSSHGRRLSTVDSTPGGRRRRGSIICGLDSSPLQTPPHKWEESQSSEGSSPGDSYGASSAAYRRGRQQERRWWEWERQSGRIANGDSAAVACDHYHRYRRHPACFAS